MPAPVGRERDLLAVGRPGGVDVVAGAAGEPLLAAPVGVHHEQVCGGRTSALPREPAAVRRPGGPAVLGLQVAGEPQHLAGGGVGDVDLAVAVPLARERDAAAVGCDRDVVVAGQRATAARRGSCRPCGSRSRHSGTRPRSRAGARAPKESRPRQGPRRQGRARAGRGRARHRRRERRGVSSREYARAAQAASRGTAPRPSASARSAAATPRARRPNGAISTSPRWRLQVATARPPASANGRKRPLTVTTAAAFALRSGSRDTQPSSTGSHCPSSRGGGSGAAAGRRASATRPSGSSSSSRAIAASPARASPSVMPAQRARSRSEAGPCPAR